MTQNAPQMKANDELGSLGRYERPQTSKVFFRRRLFRSVCARLRGCMGVLARQRKERFRLLPASLVLLGGVCSAHQHVLHSCDVATTTFALVSRDRHCSVFAAGGHLVFCRLGSTSLFGSFEMSTQRPKPCAPANPAGASRLQSLRPVLRVAELGSFSLSTEVADATSVAVGPVGGLPAVLSVV